jgi:hypothetical protein
MGIVGAIQSGNVSVFFFFYFFFFLTAADVSTELSIVIITVLHMNTQKMSEANIIHSFWIEVSH